MTVEIVMPRLGWTMEEGSIVEWLKRDGEHVQAGDIIFTIESDKAVNEVEALDSGILRIPPDSPPPGTAVPIGTLLAYLVDPDERTPFATTTEPAIVTPRGTPSTPPASTPAAPRNLAPSPPTTLPAISPRARRVAAALGVDWTGLTGSGRTSRIVERDVRQAAERQAQGEATADMASTEPGALMSGIRRLTASRLAESARTTVPVTLTTEADATRLARLRDEIMADLAGTDLPAPSYTDLMIRLAAVALGEHPWLNASLTDDLIVQHAAANIGLAVDTEAGLVVPVVRDARGKSVRQIAAETAHLIARARARALTPADMSGGTFTITNLGMYEIDAFTPVINLPECAILGLGRIVARPVVIDEAAETVGVRRMLALSLTFDHRLVDGAPAARFLQHVKHLVERPTLWLTQ